MKSILPIIIRYALLALVVASLGTWARRTWFSAGEAGKVLPEDGVVVIDFHGATRCETCREIEKELNSVVNQHFSEELKNGKLTLLTINFDEPANRHFIKEYGLVSATVVATRRKGSHDLKWQRLDDVWVHAFDLPAMTRYLQTGISGIIHSTSPE